MPVVLPTALPPAAFAINPPDTTARSGSGAVLVNCILINRQAFKKLPLHSSLNLLITSAQLIHVVGMHGDICIVIISCGFFTVSLFP